MCQADSRDHQPRDENSTPYEAERPIQSQTVFGVKYWLSLLMTLSFFKANLALLSRWSRYWQWLETLRPNVLIPARLNREFWKTGDSINMDFLVVSAKTCIFLELNWIRFISPHLETASRDVSNEDPSLFQHCSTFFGALKRLHGRSKQCPQCYRVPAFTGMAFFT